MKRVIEAKAVNRKDVFSKGYENIEHVFNRWQSNNRLECPYYMHRNVFKLFNIRKAVPLEDIRTENIPSLHKEEEEEEEEEEVKGTGVDGEEATNVKKHDEEDDAALVIRDITETRGFVINGVTGHPFLVQRPEKDHFFAFDAIKIYRMVQSSYARVINGIEKHDVLHTDHVILENEKSRMRLDGVYHVSQAFDTFSDKNYRDVYNEAHKSTPSFSNMHNNDTPLMVIHGWTWLHLAAACGNIDAVASALDLDFNVNALTHTFQSVLHAACSNALSYVDPVTEGKYHLVRFDNVKMQTRDYIVRLVVLRMLHDKQTGTRANVLISSPSRIPWMMRHNVHTSVFHEAAWFGSAATMRMLKELVPETRFSDIMDGIGASPLFYAAAVANSDTLSVMFNTKEDNVNAVISIADPHHTIRLVDLVALGHGKIKKDRQQSCIVFLLQNGATFDHQTTFMTERSVPILHAMAFYGSSVYTMVLSHLARKPGTVFPELEMFALASQNSNVLLATSEVANKKYGNVKSILESNDWMDLSVLGLKHMHPRPLIDLDVVNNEAQ